MPLHSSLNLTSPVVQIVPIPPTERATIPAYNEALFTVDMNFINFIKTLLLPTPINCYASPFDFEHDASYPVTVAHSGCPFTGYSVNNYVYGEAFSLSWIVGDTFSIKISFYYDGEVEHSMEFTQDAAYIDGAFIPAPYNTKFYTSYE